MSCPVSPVSYCALTSPRSRPLRMQLDFGGDDITQFLFALLMRTGFPYRDADITRWHDWHVLEDLKERVVVMSEVSRQLSVMDPSPETC